MRVFEDKTFLTIVLLSITFLSFCNILTSELVYDDGDFIVEWKTLENWSNLGVLLGGELPSDHKGVYRPLRSLAYLTSYQLWQENPMPYAVVAILMHLASTYLVFCILNHFTIKKSHAFIGALIFGVHPIHTEMVAFRSAAYDALGIPFFLLAFYFYLQFRKENNERFLHYSLLNGFIAYLFYELTLTLPLMIFLYDFCFHNKTLSQLWQEKKIYALFTLISIAYLILRTIYIADTKRVGFILFHGVYGLIIIPIIYFTYIQKTLLPFNLSVSPRLSENLYSNYWLPTKPLLEYAFDWQFFASIFVCILVIICGLWYLHKNRVVTFWIYWFLIALLPVTNLLFLTNLLQEKYLYIPSLALSGLIVVVLNTLDRKNTKLKKYIQLILLFLVLIFSIVTVDRNLDWNNRVSLWQSEVENAPFNPNAQRNLAAAYAATNQVDLMFKHAEIKFNLDRHDKAYNLHLIKTHIQNRNYTRAHEIINLTLGIEDLYTHNIGFQLITDAELYVIQGIAYEEQFEYLAAKRSYNGALRLESTNVNAHQGLVRVNIALQDYESALTSLNAIIAIVGSHTELVQMKKEIESLIVSK